MNDFSLIVSSSVASQDVQFAHILAADSNPLSEPLLNRDTDSKSQMNSVPVQYPLWTYIHKSASEESYRKTL